MVAGAGATGERRWRGCCWSSPLSAPGAGRPGRGAARDRGLRSPATPSAASPSATSRTPTSGRRSSSSAASPRRPTSGPGPSSWSRSCRWPPPTRRSPSRSPPSRRRPPRARASSRPVEIGSGDREPRHRRRAARRRRLGRGRDLRRHRDRASPTRRWRSRVAQRDRAAEAVVSDAQGERRGPGARPAALVAAGGRGRARRVRAAAHAVGLDRAGDLPRPEPAAAQPELQRHHPADAQRPADRRRGHQGEPRQRRLLRAPQPARRPHHLRGRGARASRPRPSRPTSGSSTTATSSRFANYDAPALEITRGGETIRLGENEGAVVPAAGAARARRRCWRGPSSPRRSTARRSTTPRSTLGWEPPQGAEAYWLEVAADADFNTMQASEWGVRDTSRRRRRAGAGRPLLAGLLARPARAARACAASAGASAIVDDETPPFVTLTAPKDGEIVTAAEVDGRGRERARRAADGERRLRAGRRQRRLRDLGHRDAGARTRIAVAAVDPAGNRTERTRGFVYRPVGAVAIALDPARAARRRGAAPDARRARSTSPASRTPRRGPALRVLGGGRRRWRCRPWSATAAASTSPCRPPTTGAAYRIEIVGAGRQGRGRRRASSRAGTRRRRRSRSTRRRRRRRRNAWLDARPAAPADAVARDRQRQRRRGSTAAASTRDGDPGAGDERHRDRRDRRGRQRRRSSGSRRSTTSSRRRSSRRRSTGRRGPAGRSRSWSRRGTPRACARPRPSS